MCDNPTLYKRDPIEYQAQTNENLLCNIFPYPCHNRLPVRIRRDIYDSWSLGESRRDIAIRHGVSESSVTNIVNECRNLEGPDRADLIRNLFGTLSKTGITPDPCAQGHRLVMIMKRIGITDEESHETFLSEISKRYVEAGRDAGRLVEEIAEYHSFLDKNQGPHGRISIPEIEAFIERKKEQESRLDERIKTLLSENKKLEKDSTELQFKRAQIESDLQWDSELAQTLKSSGLQHETVPRFVSAALLMNEHGYDIIEIASKYSKLERASDHCAEMERRATEARLGYEKSQEEIARNSLRLKEIRQLSDIGFGLAEFKQLQYLLDEVAQQSDSGSGITDNAAVKKFFDDLQNHFFDYVFLSKAVTGLKAERAKLTAADYTAQINYRWQDILRVSPKRQESDVMNTKEKTKSAAYDKTDIEDGEKFVLDKDDKRKNKELASTREEIVTADAVSRQVLGEPPSAHPVLESNSDVKTHDSVKKEPLELDLGRDHLRTGGLERSGRYDGRMEPESVEDYDRADILSELQNLYRKSVCSQDLPPLPPIATSLNPVRKKASSEDYSKNSLTNSESKFTEGNIESAAYRGSKWDTRGEKRVSTVQTDDECVCVSVPYHEITDQEKNSLSTRDPSSRFKRGMQTFRKRANHTITRFPSNMTQKTPGSEVLAGEPETAHNLNVTDKRKESSIHERESAIVAQDSQVDSVVPVKGQPYIDTSQAEHQDRHNTKPSNLRSQKPISTPSSDSNVMEADSLDSRIELSDSPEDLIEFLKSQIHAAASSRKGFRPDDITASNLQSTLKGNKALNHPNLSELRRRNIMMVRTNIFI
jgi:hypothetical protein